VKKSRVMTAVVALLAIGCAVAIAVIVLPRGTTGDPVAAERVGLHHIKVLTRLKGPRGYYFEGALTQVVLTPLEGPSNTETQKRSGPQPVGQSATWNDVEEGPWRLVGTTRVCAGNCGELDLAADTCALDLDVTGDATVLVTFRWGESCEAEVVSSS
jgi:hypothetical protein